MALSDVPKFQAAVSEDAALQENLKSVISGITEGIGMPPSAASDVDWSPLIDFAKKLGFEFSVEEIKEAIFGGGRELSEEDLDAAVGAGGLFSLASLGQFDNSVVSRMWWKFPFGTSGQVWYDAAQAASSRTTGSKG